MTTLGRAKEAAAIANAGTIEITHIAIGDGATVPSGGETELYNEVDRKAISGHGVVVGASNTAYFDIFLAADDGPYTITEAGLIDADGDLIAIARYNPAINKPTPDSGQTIEGTIRLEVAFSNASVVNVIVAPEMQVALQRLTVLPWIPVTSMTLATPPASPAAGDTYLIAAAATGVWSGHSGKIAEYTAAGWAIIEPKDGHGISLPNGRIFERVSGTYVEKVALDAQSGKWIFAPDSGTADALAVTLDPVPLAYATGMKVGVIKSANANATTTPTINVNGLGAKTIKRADGTALKAGDLPANALLLLLYDGTAFRVTSMVPSDIVQFRGFRNLVIFSTLGAQNWVVPDNVTQILVECWGGGGGGGGQPAGQANAAHGGGGGGYSLGVHAVTPGQTLVVTVGAGGTRTVIGAGNATAGGTSSVGALQSATGGGAGSNGGGAPTAQGSGGSGIGGQLNISGATSGGIYLGFGATWGATVGGAAPRGGAGGIGSTGNGGGGARPGGGGGGGGSATNGGITGGAGNGGAGGDGLVLIFY